MLFTSGANQVFDKIKAETTFEAIPERLFKENDIDHTLESLKKYRKTQNNDKILRSQGIPKNVQKMSKFSKNFDFKPSTLSLLLPGFCCWW